MTKFDHVCPWTGTAIAGKNMKYFNSFLCSLITLILYIAFMMMMSDDAKEREEQHYLRGYYATHPYQPPRNSDGYYGP